ncbi:hypothetical protein AtubIFM55763_005818 [Aspergillus tubingensis]|nr:hypothetical protein AtubIFM54640_009645 [Aspergillus tubingensis]GLA74573.1 hypothetical protein AtubIFM55763_005818 [Aspergillus tubingensis]GLB14624.1 hypothetical protein AtubIFM61612_004416 [Aspergillus tubingensis]
MFFNKSSILATTLAVFASGTVGQIINIEYGSSEYNFHEQQVQLDQLTKLDYPNTQDDPTIAGFAHTGEFRERYLEAVYCYRPEHVYYEYHG